MNSNDFERICNGLYSFSTKQREGLLDLLQSRIWLYEREEDPEFERIYEFDDSAIKIILGKTDLESLAYALKGASGELRKKIFKNMSKTALNKLNKKMEELGPVRLSLWEKAVETIFETLSALAASGEIELPTPMASIPRDFRNADKNDRHEPVAPDKSTLNSAANHSDIALCQPITVRLWEDCLIFQIAEDGSQSLIRDDGKLVMTIDDVTLEKLDQLCASYSIESAEKPLSIVLEEARRLRVNVLITLCDYSLKSLMAAFEVATWADFLWYINDSHLTRKVLAFGSPSFTNALLNNLIARRDNPNPNAVSDRYYEKGKQAMQAVLAILDLFCVEGQIWLPGS